MRLPCFVPLTNSTYFLLVDGFMFWLLLVFCCCWALFTGRVDISDLHSRSSQKVSVQSGVIGLAEQHLEEFAGDLQQQ